MHSNKIRIYVGSDHAGFEMKQQIINYNEFKDMFEFVDLGPFDNSPVDYPDYAEKLGEKLTKDPTAYGIGICGTGIGICIALNKIHGIYAANLIRHEEAALAKEHNNVNVIALSGRFVTLEENISIIKTFFAAQFDASKASERHLNRLNKIKKLEEKNNS